MNREQFIQAIKDNTTFIISGHNIKWVAILAIESLIKKCGIKRDNIVYFDDFSTDGTAKELENRNIRRITWIPVIFRNFSKCNLRDDLCVRVDQIIRCAAKQDYKTKYICFLDGDMVYQEDAIGFYFDILYEYYIHFETMPDLLGMIRNCSNKARACEETITNINQNFMWCALNEINDNGILDNQLDDLLIAAQKDPQGYAMNYDTGGLVAKAVRNSSLNALLYDGEEMQKIFTELLKRAYHFGWMASSMRNDELYDKDWETTYKTTVENMKNILPPFCEEYDISLATIIQHYTDCVKQSPACEK